MLQYFEVKGICKIEFHPPVLKTDIDSLNKLFSKNYYMYKIVFGLIYNIPSTLTLLLYDEIIEKKKAVSLVTHKSKLNRYLHRLGFSSSFVSQFNMEVIRLKKEVAFNKELERLFVLRTDKLEYLLNEIYRHYGYNFHLYKRDMIQRRLDVFMVKHNLIELDSTIALILLSKLAFKAFFLDVSINITEFFRNPQSFLIFESLLQNQYKHKKRLKIWTAGCSNGKETYSFAMILKRMNLLEKSLIYATDFNNIILEDAKAGIYSNQSYEKALQNTKEVNFEHYMKNYIVKNDNFIRINEEIMKNVLFLEHNLAIDSSFNEFDIIICKNVLIYFDHNLQKKVFSLFYDSLRFGGYLFLGESETIHFTFKDKFVEYDKKNKIYKKVA